MNRQNEQPWHFRRATLKHHQLFQDLVQINALTNAWVAELKLERPSHSVPRGISRELTEHLSVLESLDGLTLDQLLDDTSPEDVLARLDHSVRVIQAWTVQSVFEKTSAPKGPKDSKDPKANDPAIVKSVLEQIAFKLGSAFGESRHASAAPKSASTTKSPPVEKSDLKRFSDLREALLAFGDTPFGRNYPDSRPFIVKRAVAKEIQLELRNCPHESRYAEVREVASALCPLHAQWIRGFVYALNSRATVETSRGPELCCQIWTET